MPSQLPVRQESHLVDVSALRADIVREVQSEIISSVGQALSKLRLQIPAPQVTVAAPQVTVQPASVEVRQAPAPMVEVDMSEMCESLCRIEDKLETLINLLSKPVMKTVQRDSDNLIQTVTERR